MGHIIVKHASVLPKAMIEHHQDHENNDDNDQKENQNDQDHEETTKRSPGEILFHRLE